MAKSKKTAVKPAATATAAAAPAPAPATTAKKSYDEATKAAALKRVLEGKEQMTVVSRDMNIPYITLSNWKSAALKASGVQPARAAGVSGSRIKLAAKAIPSARTGGLTIMLTGNTLTLAEGQTEITLQGADLARLKIALSRA